MTTQGPADTGHRRTAGPALRRDDDWRAQAACLRLDPNFMFAAKHRAESIHICRTHCPVLDECAAYAATLHPSPTDCVMGGVAHRMYADRVTRLTTSQDPVDHCRLCPPAGTP